MRRSMMMLGLVTLVLGVAAWLAVRDVVMAWESPLADGPAWQAPVIAQNFPVRGVLSDPVSVPDGGNVQMGGLPIAVTVSDPRHEDESAALARQIRELPPGDPKAEALKTRLRAVLERTFAERQATQKKELATLQARLKSLEQTLTRRDALKDQIITRRVEALVDADRELWDNTSEPDPNQVRIRLPEPVLGPVEPKADMDSAPNTEGGFRNQFRRSTTPGTPVPTTNPARKPSATNPYRNETPSDLDPPAGGLLPIPGLPPTAPPFEQLAPPLAPGTTSFAPVPSNAEPPAPRTPSAENPNITADRSAQQGLSRAKVLSLLRAIQRAETDAKRANSAPKGALSDAELERLNSEHRFQLELLKALRAEAAAREKVLELSLRKMKLQADGAAAELARMQELLKRSAISTNEYEKTRLEAESAKIDLEQAQLELDEHQKVLETFPTPEEVKADPNVTENPILEEVKS